MRKVSGNKFIQVFLVLCVAMQVVALMPHHHHGDGEGACVNFFHVYGEPDAGCGGGCQGDHEHEHPPYHACTAHQLVIAQPERQQSEAVEESITLPDDCRCGYCTSPEEFRIALYCTQILSEEYRHRPDVVPILMRYVSTVGLTRAPDFRA